MIQKVLSEKRLKEQKIEIAKTSFMMIFLISEKIKEDIINVSNDHQISKKN